MKILIVEDDENKRNQLLGFISSTFPFAVVEQARSLHSALKEIVSGGLDLIIVDMTMPTFDIYADEHGGRPQAYAGREILRQMDRRKIVTPVIVVTQFDKFGEGADALTLDELDSQLTKSHAHTYCGMVSYNVTLEGWKEALAQKIRKVQRPIE